ncbi:MAG: Nif3-like dinuclear metal center hexameric protein [Planctomycetes bacterium]|nr:Nif3-like dinuclear metal center hexameric protein [Planctomycetota bacterium]
MPKPRTLAEVVDILHEIAPLELAAEWDNTGLLLEPRRRRGAVARVLLTVDLTEAVVAEARAARADLVVAYHPPIFHGLKRLCADDPAQRAVLLAAAAGLAVYSPHTALDAAPGGLAEWLAEMVLAGEQPEELCPCGDGDFGRVVRLPRPLPFATLRRRVERLLGVRDLRIARPARPRDPVRSVAVAAGAGGSVLRSVRADVFLTGELSHHDALAAVAAGTTVVLAGHSNTERPFLRVLQKRLRREFGRGLDVRLCRADRDPFGAA